MINGKKIIVVMPAYNEQDNIEKVVRSWYSIIEKYDKGGQSRLIVVNDGSTDKTSEKGKILMKELPLFTMIDKPNSGHGPTVIFAYKYAIQAGADYIFQTDSDGQTNPDEFEMFWRLRNQYDGVFGKRVAREDGRDRAFVEKVVCVLLKIYFGVNISDANAPFRLMKAEVLKKYLDRLPLNYNLPNIMLTTYFSYYKEKMTYRIISFKARQGGINTINIRKIITIGVKALGDFRKFKRELD